VNGVNGTNGAPGQQGIQGIQGLPGVNGTNGAPGQQGIQGIQGPPGVNGTNGAPGQQGIQGIQGPPGVNGTNGLNGINGTNGLNGINGTGGISDYAYIYNVLQQVIAVEASVPFSDNGLITSGITHSPGNPGIFIVNAGIYKITFSVSGTEPNQFALFVNNIPQAGSVYGSGAGTQQNNGQIILNIPAGATLTLVNHTSAAAVTLAADTPIGGTAPAVNASVLILKLN
jgi:hypothetical protein